MSFEHFSLGEGETPLLRSRRIGPDVGLDHLYFKLETVNPTGSYKDRFAAAAISDMRANGKKCVVTSSSGNAGSALAAYCAAAGMPCQVAVFDGAPENKLKQMLAYGAKIWKIQDFGVDPEITRDTFEYLKQIGSDSETQLQISSYLYSPVSMMGVEAIGRELVIQSDSIGCPIHHVFSCAGGGGLLLAVVRGFQAAVQQKKIAMLPAMHCVQPSGNNTIAGPLREGADHAQACHSTTGIGGLQVASVLDGNEVITACRRSGGSGYLVEDEYVYKVQSQLAREEGIFCEPAAAVSLAGVLQAASEGKILREETVVCLITGTGFKDQPSIDRMLSSRTCPVVTLSEFMDRTV
ncbi:MAG: pyridoxal-phosphate dependent enzyme [Gimesia sp.]|nr:pyridoxal-phosphate dependent enzyme [Gimesia sp.]